MPAQVCQADSNCLLRRWSDASELNDVPADTTGFHDVGVPHTDLTATRRYAGESKPAGCR